MKHYHLLLALLVGCSTCHIMIGTSNAGTLTPIIRTNDPIPGSAALTAGTVYRHPRIHGGKVAFFTDHVQFGVDKPSNSLLYWDGSSLTNVANDFTAVPGLAGGEMLEFNDLTDNNTLSMDVYLEPTVVFWASYRAAPGENYALYKWSPGGGILPLVQPGPGISYILPGQMRSGSLAFRTEQGFGPVANRGLYHLGSNGTLQQIIAPGDSISSIINATFEFVRPTLFYNGRRLLIDVNTSPITHGGLWDILPGVPPPAQPVWTTNTVTFDTSQYWSFNVTGINDSANLGVVGTGNGTRNGLPSQALLYRHRTGAGFSAIFERGDPTPGASGFSIKNIGTAKMRGSTVVFDASSENALFEQHSGIYHWGGAGVLALAETGDMVGGKQVTTATLHDWDQATGKVLLTLQFADFTAGLYTTSASIPLSYLVWTEQQFPAANANPSIVGLLEDPDGDQVVNLTEYALGGFGDVSDAETVAPEPVRVDPGTAVEFEYRRRASLSGEVSVTPEMTTSLGGSWNSGPAAIEELSATPDGGSEFERVRVRCVGAPGDEIFFRISVGHNP